MGKMQDKKLLVLLSGNAAKILKSISADAGDFVVVKTDEKELSRPGFMLRLIKSGNFNNVIFGTEDIEFQRFTFFILLYLFLSGKFAGKIADEQGRTKRFSIFTFIFKDVPLFITEIIASAFITLYFYIRFPIKLWQMKRK